MNKILITIVLSFFAHINYGQNFGVRGGLNYTNVVPNSDFDYGDSKFGFHIGIFGSFELNKVLYIRPEILYSQKGYILTFPPGGQTSELQRNLNYLSLPVITEIHPVKKLGLLIGPEFNYLLFAKEDPELLGSTDPSELFVEFDIGLILGANLSITKKIQADVRYIHGFSAVTEPNTLDDSKLQNRGFQLSVGYQLN